MNTSNVLSIINIIFKSLMKQKLRHLFILVAVSCSKTPLSKLCFHLKYTRLHRCFYILCIRHLLSFIGIQVVVFHKMLSFMLFLYIKFWLQKPLVNLVELLFDCHFEFLIKDIFVLSY
jgi:hypothetical protein